MGDITYGDSIVPIDSLDPQGRLNLVLEQVYPRRTSEIATDRNANGINAVE